METATPKTHKRLPRWAGPLIGLACVLAGSVGLVYYWRVVFYLGEVPFLPFAAGVAAVAVLVYLGLLLAKRAAKDNISARAALCVFVVGLLFVFSQAPFQAPDESSHYQRAYAISQGRFNYDKDSRYPSDVDWLFYAVSSTYDSSLKITHSARYQQGELAPAKIAVYKAGVASGEPAPYTAIEPIVFLTLPFLPAALGMALARLFGFGALGLLYAGRIANLVVYSLLCYRIYKNCDKYRGVFLAVTMLPLCLSLGASCSYDAIMLPLSFLLLSYFCKKEVTTRDLVVFALAAAFASYIKLMNILLVAVLLLVPKTRWKSKLNPWLCTGGGVAIALVFYWLMGKLDGGVLAAGWTQGALDAARTDGAQPAAQMAFLLQNPFSFLARLGFTAYEASFWLFDLGTFGWMDLTLPLVSGLSVLSLCSASALGIQQGEDTKRGAALGLLLAALLYGGAVLAGMYVLESPLHALRVSGLQPRYFLPAFLLLFMLASILLGKAVRPRLPAGPLQARTESITLWVALAVAVVAALLLFQSYFVGQWYPRLDGDGHKLVNMLGWVFT